MPPPNRHAHPNTQEGLLAYALEAVAAWHRAFGVPQNQASDYAYLQRLVLQRSEEVETGQALLEGDAEGVLDGLCDVLFVAAGSVDTLHDRHTQRLFAELQNPEEIIEDMCDAEGFRLPPAVAMDCFEEVVRANFAKLWTSQDVAGRLNPEAENWRSTPAPGQPGFFVMRDAAGKIRKPPGWTGPNHAAAVALASSYLPWPSREPAAA